MQPPRKQPSFTGDPNQLLPGPVPMSDPAPHPHLAIHTASHRAPAALNIPGARAGPCSAVLPSIPAARNLCQGNIGGAAQRAEQICLI